MADEGFILSDSDQIQPDGVRRDGRVDGTLSQGSLVYNTTTLSTTNVQDVHLSLVPVITQNVIAKMATLIDSEPNAITVAANAVTVQSQIGLNDGVQQAKIVVVEDNYPLTIAREPVVVQTEFNFTAPVVDSRIDESQMQQYLIGNDVNVRAITSSLRGQFQMSRAFSEGIVPEIRPGLNRYDLTTLFTMGHIMTTNLQIMQMNNWNPITQAMPANSIVTIITNQADAGQTAASIVAAQACINEGRVSLSARGLSNSDWQVLRALATGLPAFTRHARAQLRPIPSTFVSPGIRFMVYDDQPIAIPAASPITAAQFYTSLVRLSRQLRAEPCFVKGFVAASALLMGIVIDQNTAPDGQPALIEQIYMTSGLETRTIILPGVIAHNFLLDIMSLNSVTIGADDWSQLQPEWAILVQRPVPVLMRIMGGIASLYTFGVSTMLHMWNINGRCLNTYVRTPKAGPHCNVLPMLYFLFRPLNTKEFLPINRAACAIVAQFTGLHIMSKSFQQRSWCGGGQHFDYQVDTVLWHHEWDRTIPYIILPLCMARFLRHIPSTFGLSQRPIGANLTSSFVFSGGVQDTYYSASLGDDAYEKTIAGSRPYTYIASGNMALNFMTQHMRRAQSYPLAFREMAKSAGTSHILLPDWHQGLDYQCHYNADLHMVEIGEITTYDWFRQRVLVPHVRRVNVNDQVWNEMRLMRMGRSSTRAGIYIDAQSQMCNIDVQSQMYNFGAEFEIGHGRDIPDPRAVKERKMQ